MESVSSTSFDGQGPGKESTRKKTGTKNFYVDPYFLGTINNLLTLENPVSI